MNRSHHTHSDNQIYWFHSDIYFESKNPLLNWWDSNVAIMIYSYKTCLISILVFSFYMNSEFYKTRWERLMNFQNKTKQNREEHFTNNAKRYCVCVYIYIILDRSKSGRNQNIRRLICVLIQHQQRNTTHTVSL